MADETNVDASRFLRIEIHQVIRRYTQITAYQAIGVLDAVKMDMWAF